MNERQWDALVKQRSVAAALNAVLEGADGYEDLRADLRELKGVPPRARHTDDTSETLAQVRLTDAERRRRDVISDYLARHAGGDEYATDWTPASVATNVWRGAIIDRRITLDIAAWVSDDTVLRAYRAAQRELLGRDNRPLGERLLTLFDFVEEHPDLTWERRAALWNERHPEWSSSRSNLQKDYQRAFRGVVRMLPVVKRPSSGKTLRIRQVLPGRSTDVQGGMVKIIEESEWGRYATENWVIVEVNPSPR